MISIKKNNKSLAISIFAMFILNSFLFWLNSGHLAEQGIFKNTYTPLAESLFNDATYRLADSVFDTYPMWGYPILLAIFKAFGFQVDSVIWFHYLLLMVSLIIITRWLTKSELKLWEVLLLHALVLFYTALLSVKWPDAIVGFLLLVACEFHYKQKHLLAAVAIAIAYNFRTEAVIFLFLYIAFVLFAYKNWKPMLAAFLLFPYLFANLYFHSKPLLTTTNGGGVLYISLGQLQPNPWGREHIDDNAYKFVEKKSNGRIKSPWVCEANELFISQVKLDIISYPGSFARKVFNNFTNSITGGFYSYELWVNAYGNEHFQKNRAYDGEKQKFFLDLLLFRSDAWVRLFFIFIEILGKLTLLFSLAHVVYFRKEKDTSLIVLVVCQIILCSFIQYQPRHMSKISGILCFLLFAKMDRLAKRNNA